MSKKDDVLTPRKFQKSNYDDRQENCSILFFIYFHVSRVSEFPWLRMFC